MGAAINTPFNEDTPFITQNDSVLYFSSEGHNSLGGFDNFQSHKMGDVWKTPSNLGFPVNSPDDDKFFQPANNGLNAYYSITTDYKTKEIFYLGIGSSDVKQLFEIRGMFSLKDTTVLFDENYAIHLISKPTGDTLDVAYPNKYTGSYSFTVKPGSMNLIYTGKNYYTQNIDTTILEDNPSVVINIDVSLKKDTSVKIVIPDPVVYEKINLSLAPSVESIDSSILIKNMNVNDVGDKNINDSDILYYTVRVIFPLFVLIKHALTYVFVLVYRTRFWSKEPVVIV